MVHYPIGHLWTDRHACSGATYQGTASPELHLHVKTNVDFIRSCAFGFLRHSLKYDRSGRSSGIAIIAFETPAEATRAKKQFDGILAKGNEFSHSICPRGVDVTFHICGAGGSCRAHANTIRRRTTDVDRLRYNAASQSSQGNKCTLAYQQNTKTAPSGPPQPRQRPSKSPFCPVCSFLVAFLLRLTDEIGNSRGAGPIRSRPSRGGGAVSRPGPKKPKTAEELDKELDAFMGDSDTAAPVVEEPVVTVVEDVEMA